MKNRIILLSIASSILFASCATVFSGSRKTVAFTATTPATVWVKGTAIGITPLTTKIKRNTKKVEFRAEGYETNTINVKAMRRTNGWVWVDAFLCLSGGIMPMFIDLCDGAYINIPDSIFGDMKKTNNNNLTR